MRRAILLSMGWFLTCLSLYGLILALELYWNLYNWQPISDARAGALFCGLLIVVLSSRVLAQVSDHRLTRAVSLVMCLLLLALGIYVLPAEPLTHGVFARDTPSPLWYRAARLLIMAMPGIFWCLTARRRQCDALNTTPIDAA